MSGKVLKSSPDSDSAESLDLSIGAIPMTEFEQKVYTNNQISPGCGSLQPQALINSTVVPFLLKSNATNLSVYDLPPTVKRKREAKGPFSIHRTVAELAITSFPKCTSYYDMWVPVKETINLKAIDIRVEFTVDGQLVVEWEMPFQCEPTQCQIQVRASDQSTPPVCNELKRLDGHDGFCFNINWDCKRDVLTPNWILRIELNPFLKVDPTKTSKSNRTFKNMMEQNILTDFVIRTKDKDFSCHKLLLAYHSDYFLGMLQSDMIEARENVVDWTDVYDSWSVEALLHFIYTLRKPPSLAKVYFDLYDLAHLCLLKDLELMCISAMERMICVNCAVQVFEKAVKYELADLKTCALNFIAKTYEQVKETNSWKELNATEKVVILDLVFMVQRKKTF